MKKLIISYDADADCYICHNDKQIRKTKERKQKTASGYVRIETTYQCDECDGCPYRAKCMPGKNWKKPLEEWYKSLAVSKEFERLRADEYERITSELCRGEVNVYAESVM